MEATRDTAKEQARMQLGGTPWMEYRDTTTEEFYKGKLKVGSMLKRISDGKYFEVYSIKEVRLNGKSQMEYVLQTESGGRLTSDSHWIDCYFTVCAEAVK